MVLNDRKGELWNLTAGWRASPTGANNIVMKFNPSSPDYDDCVRFNPLDEIRIGTPSEVGDCQNVTTIIVDPDGKGLVDHWQKTAFAFLTGAILHELYKAKAEGRTASLYDVLYAVTDPARDVNGYYEEMMANKHDAANVYGADGCTPWSRPRAAPWRTSPTTSAAACSALRFHISRCIAIRSFATTPARATSTSWT
jgi:type IV secretion system protein VirD4